MLRVHRIQGLESLHQIRLLRRRVEPFGLVESGPHDRDVGLPDHDVGPRERCEHLHRRPVETGRRHVHGPQRGRHERPGHPRDHRVQHGADVVQGCEVHQCLAVHYDVHADSQQIADRAHHFHGLLFHIALRLCLGVLGGVWRAGRGVQDPVHHIRVPHEVLPGQRRFQHCVQQRAYHRLVPHHDVCDVDLLRVCEPFLRHHDPGPSRRERGRGFQQGKAVGRDQGQGHRILEHDLLAVPLGGAVQVLSTRPLRADPAFQEERGGERGGT
mmetsp:Transcript_13884/g.41307  ORF Transcript_13884/g.41307 Transcript_13884/m.41307 type:complete len:270 (-) Transcript_13884:308-1117(-)